MSWFYTGVGSRETPVHIQDVMTQLGRLLALNGWTLRSGGAIGADLAFERGCNSVKGPKEIYYAKDATAEAIAMAAAIHPKWHKCSEFVRSLHGRNCFQVLGRDLKTPSKFMVCWTLNGADVGGTRTAIVIARNNGIDTFNLGIQSHLDHILKFMKGL